MRGDRCARLLKQSRANSSAVSAIAAIEIRSRAAIVKRVAHPKLRGSRCRAPLNKRSALA
jgi:hypothetical protein